VQRAGIYAVAGRYAGVAGSRQEAAAGIGMAGSICYMLLKVQYKRRQEIHVSYIVKVLQAGYI